MENEKEKKINDNDKEKAEMKKATELLLQAEWELLENKKEKMKLFLEYLQYAIKNFDFK